MTRIRHTMTTLLLTGCALVMTMGIVCLGKVGQAEAGNLNRLSAEYRLWNGSEHWVGYPAYAGGTNIYTKTLFVPQGVNTLYITISATGDTYYDYYYYYGDGIAFRASVDGIGAPFAGAWTNDGYSYTGYNEWVILLRNDGNYYGYGDNEDNAITYTWCKPVNPGTRTVTIDAGSLYYFGASLEGAFFYIDASTQPGPGGACTQGLPPDPEQED